MRTAEDLIFAYGNSPKTTEPWHITMLHTNQMEMDAEGLTRISTLLLGDKMPTPITAFSPNSPSLSLLHRGRLIINTPLHS